MVLEKENHQLLLPPNFDVFDVEMHMPLHTPSNVNNHQNKKQIEVKFSRSFRIRKTENQPVQLLCKVQRQVPGISYPTICLGLLS